MLTFTLGCARQTKPPPEIEVRYVYPSVQHLRPGPLMFLSPQVMQDYVEFAYACEAQYAKAEAQKAAALEEVEGHKRGNGNRIQGGAADGAD